jgi:hypothetical protein
MANHLENDMFVTVLSGWTRESSLEFIAEVMADLLEAIGVYTFAARGFFISPKNLGVVRSDRYGIDIIPMPDGERWEINQCWSPPWKRRRVMVDDCNSIEWSNPDELRGAIESMAIAVEDYLAANPKPPSLLDRLFAWMR